MDGPDLTECNIITPEPTSDGLYDNWPPSISALFQSKDLTGVLNELEREIAKQNNEGKIVQLVETVSRKLVNSKGNLYEMAFLKVRFSRMYSCKFAKVTGMTGRRFENTNMPRHLITTVG